MKERCCLFVFFSTILVLASIHNVFAQIQTDQTETYLDVSTIGIRAQINATVEAKLGENATTKLVFTGSTDVTVARFNLSVFGMLSNASKMLIASIADENLTLNNRSQEYNMTFIVPEEVWDITFGELTFSHSARYGPIVFENSGLTFGFMMTRVENLYVAGLEQQVQNLTQRCEELEQNLTRLQGSTSELDSTRQLAVIFGITTMLFVATTLYLVFRKPREIW